MDVFPIPSFHALEAVYREVSRALGAGAASRCRGDGACCRFDRSGLRLFVTGLEAAYLVYKTGSPSTGTIPGACPYLAPPRCTARAGRPLGCRLYFCDPRAGARGEALYEWFHRSIAAVHGRFGLTYRYGELVLSLRAVLSREPGSGRAGLEEERS